MQLFILFKFPILLLLLLPTFSADTTWPKVIDPLMTVRRSYHSQLQTSTTSSVDEKECVECNQNKVVVNDQNPILTELRVEYVKQQILKKLRLSKPPNVSISLSTLPKPLINGNVLELRPGAPLEPEKSAESFYGKTDQIVVFPYEGIGDTKKCLQSSNHLTGFNPAACFTFYLPNEMQFVDVTSAQLWFYKEYDENDDLNQTFVLSELDHWDKGERFEKNTMVAIFDTDIGGKLN